MASTIALDVEATSKPYGTPLSGNVTITNGFAADVTIDGVVVSMAGSEGFQPVEAIPLSVNGPGAGANASLTLVNGASVVLGFTVLCRGGTLVAYCNGTGDTQGLSATQAITAT